MVAGLCGLPFIMTLNVVNVAKSHSCKRASTPYYHSCLFLNSLLKSLLFFNGIVLAISHNNGVKSGLILFIYFLISH